MTEVNDIFEWLSVPREIANVWYPKIDNNKLCKIMKFVLENTDITRDDEEDDMTCITHVSKGNDIYVVTYRIANELIPISKRTHADKFEYDDDVEMTNHVIHSAYIVPVVNGKFHGIRLQYTIREGGFFDTAQIWMFGHHVSEEIKIIMNNDSIENRITNKFYPSPFSSCDDIYLSEMKQTFLVNSPYLCLPYDIFVVYDILTSHAHDKDHCMTSTEILVLTSFYTKVIKNVILTHNNTGLLVADNKIYPLVRMNSKRLFGCEYWVPVEKVISYFSNGFEKYQLFVETSDDLDCYFPHIDCPFESDYHEDEMLIGGESLFMRNSFEPYYDIGERF
jgi:hypothetical protein